MHLFHHLPKHVTHAGLSAVKMVALAGNKTNQLSDLQRQLMITAFS